MLYLETSLERSVWAAAFAARLAECESLLEEAGTSLNLKESRIPACTCERTADLAVLKLREVVGDTVEDRVSSQLAAHTTERGRAQADGMAAAVALLRDHPEAQALVTHELRRRWPKLATDALRSRDL